MGCTNCRSSSNPEDEILSRIVDSIKQDNPSNLEYLIKLLSFQQKIDIPILINKPIIKIEKFYGNFLCYAFWLGKCQVFSYLLNLVHCSISVMEEIFYDAKYDPMMILCEKGFIEVFKVYLPLYLKNLQSKKLILKDKSITISFSNNPVANEGQSTFTPIQVACIRNHINIIHFVNEYFSNIVPPNDLDVHFKDEMTGENCALLAVRTGNFVMIKLLYESAKADFHIKNHYKEGALQILAASAKFNYSLQYIECVMYLVEVVRIDITYMHEETLLLLESNILIKYLEEKLKGLGIMVSKVELESIYRIKSYKRLDETKEKTNIVGDTQEISAIVPSSAASHFDTPNKSSLIDFS